MTFPVSLLMQIATRPLPTINTSSRDKVSSNKTLDLPKFELKENRPKYTWGFVDYRKVMKNGD